MRALVTAANSFIGQALCSRMQADGWLLKGTIRTESSAASLPTRVETILIPEIGMNTDWSDALAGIDTVVHLAARVHVTRDTIADPFAAYRQVNVAGTECLARMASSAGIKRFVFLSSVKVNGEESTVPYTELDVPAPKDPYGISKLEAEQVLYRIADETGMEAVVLRPPLVYGPGVHANFLKLLNALQDRVPLPLRLLNNRRSLVYLGNLVDALTLCCSHPVAAGNTYLVSDGEDISTPELIRRIADALGKPPRLFAFPPALLRLAGKLTGRSDNIDRLIGSLTVDTEKIRRELGWHPPFTMTEGLRETAAWYSSHIDSSKRKV